MHPFGELSVYVRGDTTGVIVSSSSLQGTTCMTVEALRASLNSPAMASLDSTTANGPADDDTVTLTLVTSRSLSRTLARLLAIYYCNDSGFVDYSYRAERFHESLHRSKDHLPTKFSNLRKRQ